MKKKTSILGNDEIDLIALFKFLWKGKIKILLILIISLLIGSVYSYQIPKNYLNLLEINQNSKDELKNLYGIKSLLSPNNSEELTDLNLKILKKFINEFEDYKNFLIYFKNSKKIQKDILELKIEDQQFLLNNFKKIIKIVPNNRKNGNYTVNFTWHDPEEAKMILEDILNFTSDNFKQKVIEELFEDLEFEKKKLFNKDLEKLEFLKEQSIIAKYLQIKELQDNLAFSQEEKLNKSMININSEFLYYLKGYSVIDKEIELIQNRKYENLEFIKQEINSLNELKIEWVSYDLNLMEVKLLKNTKFILVFSIVLGLIVGILYLFISNVIQSQTVYKKNQ